MVTFTPNANPSGSARYGQGMHQREKSRLLSCNLRYAEVVEFPILLDVVGEMLKRYCRLAD
jgi:hypothetical protein